MKRRNAAMIISFIFSIVYSIGKKCLFAIKTSYSSCLFSFFLYIGMSIYLFTALCSIDIRISRTLCKARTSLERSLLFSNICSKKWMSISPKKARFFSLRLPKNLLKKWQIFSYPNDIKHSIYIVKSQRLIVERLLKNSKWVSSILSSVSIYWERVLIYLR